MVIIRLARHGSKKRPFYQVVVAERSKPRNGAFLEKVGYFNPLIEGGAARVNLNLERVELWRSKGAQMTDRVKSLMKEVKRMECGR